MTDRLTTADARTVSGLDFFDAVFGSSPERRQQRLDETREQCILAIQRGDTYGWPPAMVDDCRKIMADREAPEQLVEELPRELKSGTGGYWL